MPSWLIAAMMTITINTIRTRLLTNVSSVLSTSCACITRPKPRITRPTAILPT